MQKFLYFLFGLLILAPVTGELWRVPIGPLAFLPGDLIIPIIFIVWVIDKLKNDRVWRFGKIGKMTALFLFVITFTYFLNLFRFPLKEMLTAFSALGRLGMYVVLAPMAYDLLERDKTNLFRKLILMTMFISMALIVLFGFLQLKFFPSFFELGLYLDGWDPHIGRLLSTWFDPNFVAGFLAFMLSITVALSLYFYQQKNKKVFLLLSVLSVFSLWALYLTFSRSGYLAMIASLFVLSFFKSRKLLIAGGIVFFLAFTFSPRMQYRTLGAVDSVKSIIGLDSQEPLDPTAALRIESWTYAWEIIEDHPWIGIAYNRYPYEVNKRGHAMLSDHAAGGSDSSLLTLWATTGVFGLLSYLAMAFVAVVMAVKQIWKKKDFKSYLSTGLLAGFAGLFVHSVFLNSLIFAQIMVYFWIGLALLEEDVKI